MEVERLTLESVLAEEYIDFDTNSFDFEDVILDLDPFDMVDAIEDVEIAKRNLVTVESAIEITTEENKIVHFIKALFLNLFEFVKRIVIMIVKIVSFPIRALIGFFKRRSIKKSLRTANGLFTFDKLNSKLPNFAEEMEKRAKGEFPKQIETNEIQLEECVRDCKSVIDYYNKMVNAQVATNTTPVDLNSPFFQLVHYNDNIDKSIDAKNKLAERAGVYKNFEFKKISSKPGLVDAYNKLSQTLVDYNAKTKMMISRTESTGDSVIKQLEAFNKEVQETDKLSDEQRKELIKATHAIRDKIVNLAKNNQNISKWFFKADKLLYQINDKLGTINYNFNRDNIVDQIMGVPILLSNSCEVACCTPVAKYEGKLGDAYSSKELGMIINEIIDSDTRDNAKAANEKSKQLGDDPGSTRAASAVSEAIGAIMIDEITYSWKQSKPRWYYFIVGHELSHFTGKDMLLKDRVTEELSGHDPRSDKFSLELIADKVGHNISDISKEEVEQIYLTWVSEAVKARKNALARVPILGKYSEQQIRMDAMSDFPSRMLNLFSKGRISDKEIHNVKIGYDIARRAQGK